MVSALVVPARDKGLFQRNIAPTLSRSLVSLSHILSQQKIICAALKAGRYGPDRKSMPRAQQAGCTPLQGYLSPPPLRPYGGPRGGGAVSFERDTPPLKTAGTPILPVDF